MKKVFPFKIPKSLHESIIVQEDKAVILYNKLHQHEEVQLTYIINGSGKLFVADSVHSFTSGDLFVIPGNSPHLFQNTEEEGVNASLISIFYVENTVKQSLLTFPELTNIHRFFELSTSGYKLTNNLETASEIIQKLPNATPFKKFSLFIELLNNLSRLQKEPLTGFVYPKEISNNEGQRMQAIFEFVTNNFQKEISLEKIADLAYMTPNAFCRFFKQRTNKTFFQFLIELRIEHACQILAHKKDIAIGENSF